MYFYWGFDLFLIKLEISRTQFFDFCTQWKLSLSRRYFSFTRQGRSWKQFPCDDHVLPHPPILPSSLYVVSRDRLSGSTTGSTTLAVSTELVGILVLGVGDAYDCVESVLFEGRELWLPYGSPPAEWSMDVDVTAKSYNICNISWFVIPHDKNPSWTRCYKLQRLHRSGLFSTGPLSVETYEKDRRNNLQQHRTGETCSLRQIHFRIIILT